jgi:hypothetical protein
MPLRAFRGGNPHERLVAMSDPNLLRACRPTLCMIKDVRINNPSLFFLRGMEFGGSFVRSFREHETLEAVERNPFLCPKKQQRKSVSRSATLT